MSFTSSAFFSLFSGLLWLLLLLLCVISHVSHALCISRYLMPLFSLFPLSLPLVGFFSVRASCNFTQFIQNQMGFFCLTFLHSPHSVFYFILFQLSVYFCLCVCVCAVIESHFNGRRFSRQFSLCCSWGQFWGQQLAQLAHWMFLLRQMNGNCPGLAVVVRLPLSLPPLLSLPCFCHKIISLVKIFHSHLCFYFAALAFGL